MGSDVIFHSHLRSMDQAKDMELAEVEVVCFKDLRKFLSPFTQDLASFNLSTQYGGGLPIFNQMSLEIGSNISIDEDSTSPLCCAASLLDAMSPPMTLASKTRQSRGRLDRTLHHPSVSLCTPADTPHIFIFGDASRWVRFLTVMERRMSSTLPDHTYNHVACGFSGGARGCCS